MRTRLLLPISLALVFGCQTGAPTRTPASPGRVRPTSTAIGTTAKALPPGTPTRVIDPNQLIGKVRLVSGVELIGKIRLLSDHGAAVVANNGGSIISNNGGTLIGKVRGEGAGLIGKVRYQLRQTTAPAEDLLADAAVEILDAAGNVLVDKGGKPLGAVSDKEGGYALRATLPDENLVLRVTLADGGVLGGGQLLAMLARGVDGRREVNIDTASSLGASYVLEKFVQKRQGVFDKLPAAEAEGLQRDLEAARGRLGDRPPSYAAADLVAAAERLRGEDAAVGKRIEAIKALLLAGQADLGRGRPATEVSLSLPAGVVGDAAGNLFIVEAGSFRIRRVDRDGRISVYAGTGARKVAVADDSIEAIGGAALAPDGSFYLTQTFSKRLRKIAPDGTVSTVVGEGLQAPGPVVLAPDGTFYIGESPTNAAVTAHVYAVTPGQPLRDLGFRGKRSNVTSGLALGPDGSLYAVAYDDGEIVRRTPDGAWSVVASGLATDRLSGLLLAPDGALYVSDTQAHRVVKIAPDGTRTIVAGTGTGGHDGDGGPARDARLNLPAGLWLAPDGALYITDADGLVRKVAPDGTITTVAGTLQTAVGDALGVSINGPGGLAVDGAGRLVISEAASNTIKRLENGMLTVIAGTSGVRGLDGDGGAATIAKLANPAGIGYAGDALYVIDTGNTRVRRIDAAGQISTVVQGHFSGAGKGSRGPYPAMAMPMNTPLMAAVSPKGHLYWTDAKANQVLRLVGDQVEVVSGALGEIGDAGDGGPANAALWAAPTGLAFDRAGDLYVCDSGNLTIRKIAGGEPTGTVTRFAGLPMGEAAAKFLATGTTPQEEGIPALEAALAVPSALCVAPDGALIVAELGTSLAILGRDPALAAMMAQLPPIGARLRRIAPDGMIRTIAGEGTQLLADPATDDTLIYPLALTFDREGRLIIADAALNQVKMLPTGSF